MSPVIDQQLEAVQQLCRGHYVARLELFGSAANGNFDSTESDLDFLVEFEPLSPSDRADAYFGLLATLLDLFGREIDLVEVEAVTNPYFLQSLAATRKVLYAA
jgi:hypothetical protein